jgi:WD40 repeat protein
VYDLRDEKWIAVINNGSGGMGKNAHVEFGADENEVFVWSDFGACAKVWSLKSGRTTEIRDPKFTGRDNKGWGYRPIGNEGGARNRVLALLCRTLGQDILLLLAPRTYAVINRVELPTIDAVGLKWSRDGRWIAIWDTPSAGYSLCIYTADGHLYRTIAREPTDDISEWAIEGLGIKSVEWVPGAEFLAVGGWDRRVRILSTRTFSPVVFLDHTAVIHVPSAPVYSEQVDAQGSRSYRFTSQPVTPPKAPVEKNETSLMKQGISILAFNKDGTYCATRDDSTPSTVWIWELRSLRPRTILIQHAPIKSLRWHHNDPSLLLIQTVQDSPTIYLYTASSLSASAQASSAPVQALPSPPPEILTLSSHMAKPTNSVLPRWTLSWLSTAADKKPAFTLAHQQGYIFAWPLGKDQILRFDDEDASGDESEDSLYDILTGRTPLPRLHNQHDDVNKEDDDGDEDEEPGPDVDDSILAEQQLFAEEEQYSNLSFDDTFRGKAPLQARPRGRSVLDDSGLDEMF